MPEQSNDYRVVVFGAGGVGKSSLVLRFVKGTFRESYIPTIEDTYRQVITTLSKTTILSLFLNYHSLLSVTLNTINDPHISRIFKTPVHHSHKLAILEFFCRKTCQIRDWKRRFYDSCQFSTRLSNFFCHASNFRAWENFVLIFVFFLLFRISRIVRRKKAWFSADWKMRIKNTATLKISFSACFYFAKVNSSRYGDAMERIHLIICCPYSFSTPLVIRLLVRSHIRRNYEWDTSEIVDACVGHTRFYTDKILVVENMFVPG